MELETALIEKTSPPMQIHSTPMQNHSTGNEKDSTLNVKDSTANQNHSTANVKDSTLNLKDSASNEKDSKTRGFCTLLKFPAQARQSEIPLKLWQITMTLAHPLVGGARQGASLRARRSWQTATIGAHGVTRPTRLSHAKVDAICHVRPLNP